MKEFGILALIIIVVGGAAVMGSRYYRTSTDQARSTPAAAANLVREDSQVYGEPNAKVTIVEFYDPECESCATFGPMVKKIVDGSGGRVRLVGRYMPLHPNSVPAANFIEVAGLSGKYWEAQDMLFRKQPEWGEKHGAPANAPKADVPALLEKYAMELGIDPNSVVDAVRTNRFGQKIERDRQDGQSLGVRKTPTLFVNGRMLPGLDLARLRSMVEEELAKQ